MPLQLAVLLAILAFWQSMCQFSAFASDFVTTTQGGIDIHLANGKTIHIENPSDPAAGPATHVAKVSAKENWVLLEESGPEVLRYQLIQRANGTRQTLQGFPIWSGDEKYFVALHEDLESGMSDNEASLWSCPHPGSPCTRIWTVENPRDPSDSKNKIGGRKARWSGPQVEITVSRELLSKKGVFQEQERHFVCRPRAATPHCSAQGPWKPVGTTH